MFLTIRTRVQGLRALMFASMLLAVVCVAITPSHGRSIVASSPTEVLHGCLRTARLAHPRSHGAITIVPIRNVDVPAHVTLLSAALSSGQLHLSEIGSGRVNELEVENDGKTPVFIMAGQILVGAKQNRVLQYDLLLPAQSGRVTVQAFCVQHGRWSYENSNKSFSHSDNVSNPQVRQAATVAKAQGAVWHSVAVTRSSVGASAAPTSAGRPDTGDLNDVFDEPKVRDRVKADDTAFRNLPDAVPDMQGAIVIINGRVVAADVFGDRSVFRRLWNPLLASYLLDGVHVERYTQKNAVDLAQNFLQQAVDSDLRRIATPGSGVVLELAGKLVGGDALVMENASAGVMMHLDMFPGGHVSQPEDDINEPPIQRRR